MGMALLEKVDWKKFVDVYNSLQSDNKRAEHLISERRHFDTRPEWVSAEVWSLFLDLLRKK